MKLSRYDDQCVRVTMKDGEVFEGACAYDSAEYCESEYGRNEDALHIAGWLFYESQIRRVEIIDESHPFTAPFGRIEEETLADGPWEVEDLLFDDDPRNALRMLACLEARLAPEKRRGTVDMLEKLVKYTDDAALKKEAARVAEMWKKDDEI